MKCLHIHVGIHQGAFPETCSPLLGSPAVMSFKVVGKIYRGRALSQVEQGLMEHDVKLVDVSLLKEEPKVVIYCDFGVVVLELLQILPPCLVHVPCTKQSFGGSLACQRSVSRLSKTAQLDQT